MSARHPWRTLGAWGVAIVAAIVAVVMFLGDVLTGDVEVTAPTESRRADAVLVDAFPQDRTAREREVSEVVVVRVHNGRIADVRDRLDALAADLRAAGATRVVADDDAPVSRDGDARAILVGLGSDGEDDLEEVYDAVQRLDDEAGFDAAITGELSSDADEEELSLDDLRTGELLFGLPVALVILLLVFGTLVAGLVPIILALSSILAALGLVALLGQAYDLSIFTVNMLNAMGLALGIDYSLFVLSRFREERSAGLDKLEAIAVAGRTASRTVLFSGMTFVLAMFGLVLVPSTIFRSLAAGAFAVGIVSVVAALTLLPAVLSLLGDRVNALRIPVFGRVAGAAGGEGRFWGAIVRAVMRRPVAGLTVATALLVALALPVLQLDTGSQGPSSLPDRFESKQGYVLLNQEFPGQTTEPVEIAVIGRASSPELGAGVQRLEAELARHAEFGAVASETNAAGEVTKLTIPIAGDPLGDRAIAAVRDLRADVIPRSFRGSGAEVLVGGDTADELDFQDTVDGWLFPVFALVLGLSLVLLTIAFRSIVVPLKAIALNLLSVGAAYGLLVLVFQEGVGNEVLGLSEAENIAAWVPLFLFAVLFGLSMDYQVFLLSRIRERYLRTGDSDEAVAYGVGSTARLITGAALIIIAVFWGFAMGDLIMFQQMGFGVAVALLIDATIVRCVLLPASMKLLGRWNWYLPAWLAWVPDAHVEGARSGRMDQVPYRSVP